MMNKKTLITVGVVAAVGLVVVMKLRSQSGSMVRDLGYAVGAAAFDAVDGVLTGAVFSVGDAIGVPRTNITECERAKAEGRIWDASFACPALDFLSMKAW